MRRSIHTIWSTDCVNDGTGQVPPPSENYFLSTSHSQSDQIWQPLSDNTELSRLFLLYSSESRAFWKVFRSFNTIWQQSKLNCTCYVPHHRISLSLSPRRVKGDLARDLRCARQYFVVGDKGAPRFDAAKKMLARWAGTVKQIDLSRR